jgi:hypothetical protein
LLAGIRTHGLCFFILNFSELRGFSIHTCLHVRNIALGKMVSSQKFNARVRG